MALWVDKYAPKNFPQLTFHEDINGRLEKISSCEAFPHILMYGPFGAGKRTRLCCLLKGIYGEGTALTKLENMTFTAPSNAKVEIMVTSSSFHIEINPSDVGIYDRVVVQELIKASAQTLQIPSKNNHKTFKVVVINEANKLTREAQHALRRTMEKYAATCRLILVAESLSGLIGPILSRCLCISITAPKPNEIIQCLKRISEAEQFNLPDALAERIVHKSNRNVRRAILMLEACRTQNFPLSSQQEIIIPQFETYIQQTAQLIIEKQTPDRLMEIRDRLYQLQIRCIPASIVVSLLLNNLINCCDNSLKNAIIQAAAQCQVDITNGNKTIIHLEAFVAKVMCEYKDFFDSQLMDV